MVLPIMSKMHAAKAPLSQRTDRGAGGSSGLSGFILIGADNIE